MSLICPKCNTANLDEAKFCKNCGVNIANALIKEKNDMYRKSLLDKLKKASEENNIKKIEEQKKAQGTYALLMFLGIAVVYFLVLYS